MGPGKNAAAACNASSPLRITKLGEHRRDRSVCFISPPRVAETNRRQGIARGQLTIHADRGSSMKSKPVALLMADLGVTKTHSRPHVSNDNHYSEAQFKTLRYRPDFPGRFGCLYDARAHGADFSRE
jgi:transposase InsO family protein